ncbi:MAG: DUF4139 domain-containing protein [Alphaproteobacteria bacterium]
MKKSLFLTTLCSAGLAVAETIVPMNAQTNLNLTIYNDSRALVKDERRVSLTKGLNELAFTGVSANIIPQTALLSGVGLTTLEQNFNFDLLNLDSLLKKSVGKTVHTKYIDPTGKEVINVATLLAYNDDRWPLLKIGGKIETYYPAQIFFDGVPANLRAEPTLIISALSEHEVSEPVQLDYLTTGMDWSADYIARLESDEKQMSLNGFVTLTNRSGTDYNNAALQLVAGKVNTVHEEASYVTLRSPRYKDTVTMSNVAMEAETLSDFYLYTVPHKTTLLSNQTKQVALLEGDKIAIQKTYELTDVFPVYADEVQKVKPQIYLAFENSTENQLGMPLPKGVVRLYKQDAKGGTQFVGEDRIDHTADKETVRLKMGEAFNLTGEMKRTNYSKISDKIRQASFEITLKNASENPVSMDIKQSFPNGFKVMEQSLIGEKATSNQMKWRVQVPAKEKTTLTYKIRWEN